MLLRVRKDRTKFIEKRSRHIRLCDLLSMASDLSNGDLVDIDIGAVAVSMYYNIVFTSVVERYK